MAQENNNLKNAIKLGEAGEFEKAITILKKEVETQSKNAEAYYWLGRYAFYSVYKNRSLTKENDNEWSRTMILANLKKAVKLNPALGDAYYYIAVEHGARALEYLKNNNPKQAKAELIEARKAGGFPDYAIEYGRSILNACDKNAILFINGDTDLNIIEYLQLVEGVRKDVSLIVVSLLENPDYVQLIENGISKEITQVSINRNAKLIRKDVFKIPVSDSIKKTYQSNNDYILLNIYPEQDEKLKTSTIFLLNIIKTNQWERPIYFSTSGMKNIIVEYLLHEGFVSKLMPYKTVDNSSLVYNEKKLEEQLLNPQNYKYFSDIKIHNQPRAAYFFGNDRRNRILMYVNFLTASGRKEKAKVVLSTMDTLMPQSVYPLSDYLGKRYTELRKFLDSVN
jgi:hypothetical protein